MAHVFISYAREDKPFVSRLHAALEARGLAAWVDWEDIPPSADWMQEIQRAIVAADAFVFVISIPSSCSKTCSWEASTASENGKRIIPILFREVEVESLPEAIRARNWIHASQDEWFDRASAQLEAAILTDLDRVRYESRLQVRASEWKLARGKDATLLRSWELEEAEKWLKTRHDGEPKATELVEQYVAASRWAKQLADAEMMHRQTLAHLNRSQPQAAAAHLIRTMEVAPTGAAPEESDKPSNRRDLGDHAWILFCALRDRLNRLRVRCSTHSATVTCLAIDTSGERLLTGDFDGNATLWDLRDGALLRSLDSHRGMITSLAFTGDGYGIWNPGGTEGAPAPSGKVRLLSRGRQPVHAVRNRSGAPVRVQARRATLDRIAHAPSHLLLESRNAWRGAEGDPGARGRLDAQHDPPVHASRAERSMRGDRAARFWAPIWATPRTRSRNSMN